MKKPLAVAFLLAFLLLSTITPTFAKPPADLTIHVRNQTGQVISISLKNSDGQTIWVNLPIGASSLTLPPANYSYWAALPCGHIAGNLNVANTTKTLWLGCDYGLRYDSPPHTHKAVCDRGVYVPAWHEFYSYTHWSSGDWTWWQDVLTANFNGVYGCLSQFDASGGYYTHPN